MRKMRWVLLVLAGLAGLVAGGIGSCAIDDEPTWITDTECSGCRSQPDLSSYECDTDSSCTRIDGCVDWDCAAGDDGPPDGGPPDTFVPDAPSPEDVWDAPWTGEEGGTDDGADNSTDPGTCEPFGGGASLETAQELATDSPLAELRACSFPSRWFKFSVSAGERFEVVLQPAPEQLAEFLLYAEDGSRVASAEMDADASFAAEARMTATYYLRVRAVGPNPVDYSLVVRLVP